MKLRVVTIKSSIMTFMFAIAYIFLFLDALRNSASEFGILKYAMIVFLALLLVALNPKKSKGDSISYISLSVFIFFTTVFTIVDAYDWDGLMVLFGYWVMALIYVASISLDPMLENSLTKAMTVIGVIFLAVNLFYLSNPLAYSLTKNQFTGVFSNANFLAGIASCFLLFFAFKKRSDNRLLALIDFFAVGACVILLGAAFSRGAVISVVVVLLLYFAKKGFVRIAIFGSIALAIIYFLITGIIDYSSIADRGLLEDTGRFDIFNRYLEAFRETYMIIGTGVAANSGRIKSELSYFDVMLFSGVGAIGFFLFIGRSIYFAFNQPLQSWSWVEPIFLNIVVISLFEGYAANVASVPSLLFYMLPAIILSKIKKAGRTQA